MIRFYLAVKWVGWRVIRPLGLKDRWGFNLGEDLHDWATMQSFRHLRKMEQLAGFEPVELTRGPRVRIIDDSGLITTSATGTTSTLMS